MQRTEAATTSPFGSEPSPRILVGGGEVGRRLLAEARQRTMWQAINDSATRFADKLALVGARDTGEIDRLSYGGLTERVRSLSAGLAATGVRRGDRVVLWMTNSVDWIVASFATMRLGATVVPVNTFLKAPEIHYVIAQSGARHLIMLDRFRKLDMPAMLAEICPAFATAHESGNLCEPGLPDLRHVVMLSRDSSRHAGADDFRTLEDLGRAAESEWAAVADRMATAVLPTDIAMIKYTSGSTGFPKGVVLEQGGMIASGVIHARRVGATADDVFFSMMPFFHGGGSIWGQMTMLVNGGRLVFTEAFDPKTAVKLLEEEKATMMFGVLANEVVAEARAQGKVFTSLRTAHVPNEDGRKVMPNVDFNIMPFGLTESYGPAAVSSRDDPREKLGCSGRMLDGYELRVVNPETLKDVPPGEPGEAWLRGNIMRGYWNKAVETAKAFSEDGWLRSEDLIRVDAEGYISYVGRIKLMLKVGGENVSIEEVETVVASHEAIAACGALGVPDARRQEVVRVYVSLRPGKSMAEVELRDWLGSRLARFKQPRDILFVSALPRLANGKIDRITLQKWANEDSTA
jgi:fatty-acyl-CoA synthase